MKDNLIKTMKDPFKLRKVLLFYNNNLIFSFSFDLIFVYLFKFEMIKTFELVSHWSCSNFAFPIIQKKVSKKVFFKCSFKKLSDLIISHLLYYNMA